MTLSRSQRPSSNGGPSSFTPWIFILKDGMLPGQFYIQPFRPKPQEVPSIVLEEVFSSFLSTVAQYEIWTQDGLLTPSLNSLAGICSSNLFDRFGGQVPVQVIPYEEFLNRAERGEFEIRECTNAERRSDGWRFHRAVHRTLDKKVQERGNHDFLWRLQSATQPASRRHFSTASAWLHEVGDGFRLTWQRVNKPKEIVVCTKRVMRLPVEHPDHSGRPSGPVLEASDPSDSSSMLTMSCSTT